MIDGDYTLADVVALLVESGDNGLASHRYSEDVPMPSEEILSEIVEKIGRANVWNPGNELVIRMLTCP